MSRHGNVLDESTLKNTVFSLEDLSSEKQYDAIITDVNYQYSKPLQVALSPFVKGSVNFDRIVDPDTLLTEGSSYLQKFQVGATVKVFYNSIDGDFSLIKLPAKPKDNKVQKSDIAVVRLVKGVYGKGVTV